MGLFLQLIHFISTEDY